MGQAFLEVLKENAVALHLSEEGRKTMTSELAAISYPIIADLLEFANSLAVPLPDKPTKPTRVSVLLDPFNLYRDGSDPPGNSIGFMKMKNTVRSPSQPPRPVIEKPVSRKKPASATATKDEQSKEEEEDDDIEEEEDEDELSMDYYSLEVQYLPVAIERAVQRGQGVKMESFPISKIDLKAMMASVEKHGIPHERERHQDTVSLVCYPSENKLDEMLVETLSEGLEYAPEIADVVERVEAEVRKRRVSGLGGGGGGGGGGE